MVDKSTYCIAVDKIFVNIDELVKSQSARHCEESASGGRRGNLMVLSAFLKKRLLRWRSQ
jgi:hypothetical protein